MNRLANELQRLYLMPSDSEVEAATSAPATADGPLVRALVMELARPADWDAMGRVWQGVQADLDWPAPAIAVSGVDGYQLWFSLGCPLPMTEGLGILEALRLRYLGDIARERVRLMATGSQATAPAPVMAPLVPAQQASSGHWSAFVASDLARIFAEEPWLDLVPNPDAQADLLSRLDSIKPSAWKRGVQVLQPGMVAATTPKAQARSQASTPTCLDTNSAPRQQAREFLLGVMNDPAVAVQWRIEAAKALMAHGAGPQTT